jgi:hypothetical protein
MLLRSYLPRTCESFCSRRRAPAPKPLPAGMLLTTFSLSGSMTATFLPFPLKQKIRSAASKYKCIPSDRLMAAFTLRMTTCALDVNLQPELRILMHEGDGHIPFAYTA